MPAHPVAERQCSTSHGHRSPRTPQVNDPAVEGGLTCAEFHPDGLILGTGTADALVRIWEVRQQKARPSHD